MTNQTSGFDLAQAKPEGSATQYDTAPAKGSLREETFWLERAFTKEQFLHLAFLLESSSEAFARQLGADCRDFGIRGY